MGARESAKAAVAKAKAETKGDGEDGDTPYVQVNNLGDYGQIKRVLDECAVAVRTLPPRSLPDLGCPHNIICHFTSPSASLSAQHRRSLFATLPHSSSPAQSSYRIRHVHRPSWTWVTTRVTG